MTLTLSPTPPLFTSENPGCKDFRFPEAGATFRSNKNNINNASPHDVSCHFMIHTVQPYL